jgi:hypothetical protein
VRIPLRLFSRMQQLNRCRNLGPLKSVRVDALVVLKICKHASSAHPQIVTGQLLGTRSAVFFAMRSSFSVR